MTPSMKVASPLESYINLENCIKPLESLWVECSISDICGLINGRAFKPNEWSRHGLPIVRIQNLNDEAADYNYCNFNVNESIIIDKGQLLFAWSGTPGTSFGAHIWKGGKAVLNQHIFKVEIEEQYLDKRFVMYSFNHNLKDYIAKAHGTAGLAHITKGKFENSSFLLPPLPEQHRIVAKIEELFSDLDAGVEALKKVKAELKRYRQAVLKAAVEGKLTEEWREKNKDKLEPASVMLERIRVERAKNGKAKKLPTIDTSGLPRLPEEWAWAKVEDVCDINMGQSPPGDSYNSDGKGIPLINGPVEFGPSAFSKTLKTKFTTSPTKLCKENDLILCVRGSTTGRMNIAGFDACIGRGVAALRALCNQNYLNIYVHSQQRTIFELGTGSTFPNVSSSDIANLGISVPPVAEQQQVVSEVERRLSVADDVEETVDAGLKQAERLRQSILKRAFEGKLVPQDPSDEPAEKLLERIREIKDLRSAARRKSKSIKEGRD